MLTASPPRSFFTSAVRGGESPFFNNGGLLKILAKLRLICYIKVYIINKHEVITMKRTELRLVFANPEAFTEEPIKICGWLRTSRNSKSIGFIELNDGTCFTNIQVVYEEDKVNNFKEINKLNVGAAVSVIGNIILTPEAKQPFEIHATEVITEGESTPDYPLQKKRHSLEYLRTIAHLRPRTNTFSAAFRVRSAAAFAIHQFFQSRGFVYVHTPLITGSDCEGAGEMFRVTTLDPSNPPRNEDGSVDFSQDFFGKATGLTV